MTVPGVYSPEQAAFQAHVEKVIASDGSDDSRAVEVMARAIAKVDHNGRIAEEGYWADPCTGCNLYRVMARAALGALRALEE